MLESGVGIDQLCVLFSSRGFGCGLLFPVVAVLSVEQYSTLKAET